MFTQKTTSATYKIELPAFAGPLDLLLHLIERQELDVTAISLVTVTEQYLAQIEKMKEDRIDHLVDFLVIAARLLLIKSRALLPKTPAAFPEAEQEEDPAEALVRQLRQYRQFKVAAGWLRSRENEGMRTYLRVAPPPKIEGSLDLSGISVQTLIQAMRAALERVGERDESVSLVRPRRITIDGQMDRLRQRLKRFATARFEELLPAKANRLEVTVTLLAILEMIKRREIAVRQVTLFGPIEIVAVTGLDASSNSEA